MAGLQTEQTDSNKSLKKIFGKLEKEDGDLSSIAKDFISDIVWIYVLLNVPIFDAKDPTWSNLPKTSNYCKQCQDELTDMKNRKFEGSLVTYYDFFKKSKNILARYLRNDQIVKEFKSKNCEALYPIYSSMLLDKFNMAADRHWLMESVSAILSATLPFAEPDHLAFEIILKYLSEQDMLQLIRSSSS